MTKERVGGVKIPNVTVDKHKNCYLAYGNSGGSGSLSFGEQVAKEQIRNLEAELKQERITREELQIQFEKDQKEIDGLRRQLIEETNGNHI